MQKNNDRSFWFWLGSLAFMAGVVVYWVSAPYGLGLAADSIACLQAAKHFLLGYGIAFFDEAGKLAPMGHFPPVFPVVLSAAWFLGLSFFEWARLLNAFFFAGSIFLAGSIVFYVRGSRFSALAAALVLMASVPVLKAYGMLGAEALFVCILLGWFWLLLLFVDTGRRCTLYGAACCAGFAALTDYSGLAVIMAGGAWLWFKGRADGRVRDALLFLSASLVLPLVWFVRNAVLTGSLMGGKIDGILRFSDRIAIAVNSCSEWLLPSRVPLALRWIVLAAALVLVLKWLKGRCRDFSLEVKRAKLLAIVFGGIYFFSGLSGLIPMYGGAVLDHKALVPVYVILLLGIGFIVPKATLCRKTTVVLLSCFLMLALARSMNWAVLSYKNGCGYSSKVLGSSKLAETLRSIDDRVPLYSNDPAAVYYFTGRPAARIPAGGEKKAGILSMKVVMDDFSRRRAVAVVFSAVPFHPAGEWERAAALAGLEPLFKDGAGDIWGVRKK